MGYQYEFYRSPVPQGSEREERLHARVVPSGTIHLRGLAEVIQAGSTATVGDVMLVVGQLVEHVREQLGKGMRVHIDGLGYLELTLKCRPVQKSGEIRSESIHVKSISLRPDSEMKSALATFKAVRSKVKRHSALLSDEEIDKRLRDFFENNPFMTSRDFSALCGFTKTTAARRLQKLVAEGKLQWSGHMRSPLYMPVSAEE